MPFGSEVTVRDMATLSEIAPVDPQWAEVLGQNRHDCYHTAEYLLLMASQEPLAGVKGLFYQEPGIEIFLPILVRPLPDLLGGADAGSDFMVPYGYGGPIGSGLDNPDLFHRWVNALGEWAVNNNIHTGFLRWHPLLSIPMEQDTGSLSLLGATVAVDLTGFQGDVDAAARPTHRSEIRWLLRNGYSVVWDDWDRYEDFRRLYAATMARLAASSSYRYSSEYFQEMRRRLGGMLHLGVVMCPAGQVAAAALFTECDGIVQYSLSASDESMRKKSPTKLLVAAARGWAKSRGNQWLHLGGGLGSQRDKLFQFKAGFSETEMPFAISKLVFNQHKYDVLCRHATELAHRDTDANRFPAYRAILGD